MSEPLELDRQQCLELLASTVLGRVALSDRALPVVLPVMYRLAPDSVEFEASGRLLPAAANEGQVVCFEADAAGTEQAPGWSVLVIGRLHVVSTGPSSPVALWPAGDGGITVRLPTTIISGRVLGPVAGPTGVRP